MIQRSVLTLLICWLGATNAFANDYERYDYCRDRARDMSGYNGPIPAERSNGGEVLKGALKGSAAGLALGWITDSDKKKAAKRGAAAGALFAALKKAGDDKKRRDNRKKRDRYERELDLCMNARR